jgi:acyl dehydratase
MRFEDFYEGQILKPGSFTLNEQEIIDFAKAYDPQWFHTDVEAAAKGPYNGLIASGWHTCSKAMRLVVDTFLKDSNPVGSPGLAYLKWPAPVRPGDVIDTLITMKQVRISSSKPGVGILVCQWQAFNQDQVEVLDLQATIFFDLKI